MNTAIVVCPDAKACTERKEDAAKAICYHSKNHIRGQECRNGHPNCPKCVEVKEVNHED